MTDLPAAPFTTLTVERTDADSPLDETLMQDYGVNDNFLKARTDTLIARVDTIEAVTSLQAGEIDVLQAQVTTLQDDLSALGEGAVLLSYLGLKHKSK